MHTGEGLVGSWQLRQGS